MPSYAARTTANGMPPSSLSGATDSVTFIAERVDGKKFLPGYHMNKQHWFTVPLDGTVPSEELFRLLDESRTLALAPARRR